MEKIAKRIFDISTEDEFNNLAIKIFRFQLKHNEVYKRFASLLKINPDNVKQYSEIPFLPVEFFKTHNVVSFVLNNERFFESSGTTGQVKSRHYIFDEKLYVKSLIKCFNLFYGKLENWCIIALTPTPVQNSNSSLIFMLNKLISLSVYKESGFYLDKPDKILSTIEKIKTKYPDVKILIFGLTFALLDISEKLDFSGQNLTIFETGGMKGRREEMTKTDLHFKLKERFPLCRINSEYSMTELFSQAYSTSNGIFYTPPWMKVIIREPNDYTNIYDHGKTGCVNIIDLANIYTCSFIATQDLGVKHKDNGFEIKGRVDYSDLRGCSLMYQ